MGKLSRPYSTGHLRLYKTSKSVSDKPLSVQLEYAAKSVAVRRSTGVFVKEKDWNPNENKGRGGLRASYGPDYRNINNRLSKQLDDLDAKIADWCMKHPNQITVEIVRAFLDGLPTTRDDKGIDFAEFVTDILANERSRNKIGQSVYKNGLSGMNIFGSFLKAEKLGTYARDKIYVSEITTDIIDRYIKWRREFKKNCDETINHALTPILKGCHHAAIKGYITPELNAAIQEMRIIKTHSLQNDDQTKVKHLSKKELTRLIKFYHNDKEERRREYVEMFLFAFHACGLRIVDVMTLQWSHINFEKKELSKILIKTSKRHKIPLTEPALRILHKWQGLNRRSKYVFDLVKDSLSLNDADMLYRARNSATKCINQSIRVVGERIGIEFPLSFHSARHTFAVHALNDGLTMTVVSRLLGHGSTDITEKVYARLLPQTLTAEVERLNYSFLPEELQ